MFSSVTKEHHDVARKFRAQLKQLDRTKFGFFGTITGQRHHALIRLEAAYSAAIHEVYKRRGHFSAPVRPNLHASPLVEVGCASLALNH